MNTTPWFDSALPPMKRVICNIEYMAPGGILVVMPVRVVEADGKLLICTANAVYEEAVGDETPLPSTLP